MIKLQAEVCKFIKIETPMQVFSCEFLRNFKNAFFYRTPQVAASEKSQQFTISVLQCLQRTLAINYISYFPCCKKMIHTLFFIKTRKLHFMFTLLRFFGIWFWNVLNLFLIYSGQWINFDNHTLIQMTAWLI